MISIIICSRNDGLLTNLKNNIKTTIGTDYEIVVIDNKSNTYSISEAYNYGAKKAKFPYLCFIHEDILFHTNNWGVKLTNYLADTDIALVGILGSVIKTKTPSEVFIPISHLNRINQLQRRNDNGLDRYYENPFNEVYSEVKILDGMFLATTKNNHFKYPFDSNLLTGFHGYDIDFSLGQSKNGKVVVVYTILIEHLSYGGHTRQWIDAQLLLKHKWLKHLPQYFSLSKYSVSEAEIKNIETFLIALFANNYKKNIQLQYLIQLISLRFFSRKNFFFIRRFFIYGKFENILKSFINKV